MVHFVMRYAAKAWITEASVAFLANTASEISAADLTDLLDLISPSRN